MARGGRVYLSNTHGGGSAATGFDFGDPLLAGAWTAGGDTVASYRSAAGVFALRHSNSAGIADTEIEYGNSHTIPIAGVFGSLPGGDEPPKSPPRIRTSARASASSIATRASGFG